LSAALYLTLSGIEVCNAWFMRCTLVLVVEVKVRRGIELSFSMVSTLRTHCGRLQHRYTYLQIEVFFSVALFAHNFLFSV
jgi:hypothetical protein